MINGSKATLDISGLNSLLIAGRSYIGRDEKIDSSKDILMGEAIAVKANQVAYYIPNGYIDLEKVCIDAILKELNLKEKGNE